LEVTPERCVIENYLIKPSAIHYLRFILEAYEGIGTMTTQDSSLGWIQLNIAPGCQGMMAEILCYERDRLELRSLTVTS
jgi:hypothetical protein